MKKDKREVYQNIIDLVEADLCIFCKFASWSGGCSDCKFECEHPLEAVYESYYGDSRNCWGFRPYLKLKDIVDIVGIVLSMGFSDWSWSGNRKTDIHVMGKRIG